MRWILLFLCGALLAGCESPSRQLRRPNAVALGAEGQVYVSDFRNQRVVVFGPAGDYLSQFGHQGLGRDELWELQDLVPTEDGGVAVINRRIVSYEDETDIWELKRYDARGREVAAAMLTLGAFAPLGFGDSLTPGPDGTWYVADSEHDAIQIFSGRGDYLDTWRATVGGDLFVAPTKLVPSQGNLWMVEQHMHRVREIAADDHQVVAFGEEGHLPGQLLFPTSLGVCPDEWVVVADLGNFRVQRFSPEGDYIDGFDPEPLDFNHPVQLLDVAVSPDCERLYLVDSKGSRVLVTDPDGKVLQVLDSW